MADETTPEHRSEPAPAPKSAKAATAPIPPPIPDLPDPIHQLNAIDRALQSLAEEEKRMRDELAVKDPLESTADTLYYASELLLVVQAIDKLKLERGAAVRRIARGF